MGEAKMERSARNRNHHTSKTADSSNCSLVRMAGCEPPSLLRCRTVPATLRLCASCSPRQACARCDLSRSMLERWLATTGRCRNGKDPFGDGTVRRCVLPAARGAVRHGDGADQRSGRGGACQPTQSCAGRWERLDLICIDELGYVPLAETACELMFQVIADRAEKAAVIVTTNLPFSEWSQVIPNPRPCKALINRLTDRDTSSPRARTPIGSDARRRTGRAANHERTRGEATLSC
jgi:IstB-like ATP binding protein